MAEAQHENEAMAVKDSKKRSIGTITLEVEGKDDAGYPKRLKIGTITMEEGFDDNAKTREEVEVIMAEAVETDDEPEAVLDLSALAAAIRFFGNSPTFNTVDLKDIFTELAGSLDDIGYVLAHQELTIAKLKKRVAKQTATIASWEEDDDEK